MKSRKKHPMKNVIHVDEFVIGGNEKGKVGRIMIARKIKLLVL